ncbi:hypothetical protein E2C01_034193 [Portunus trituberculatus]|uniref:Uncharacterized protein n=1 Tax=Portunus trituberculatus TaxID=210409 RepID=A0A5B7EZX3_PORTR|nr:hypothetical protein [Portunus trituberculatus]
MAATVMEVKCKSWSKRRIRRGREKVNARDKEEEEEEREEGRESHLFEEAKTSPNNSDGFTAGFLCVGDWKEWARKVSLIGVGLIGVWRAWRVDGVRAGRGG